MVESVALHTQVGTKCTHPALCFSVSVLGKVCISALTDSDAVGLALPPRMSHELYGPLVFSHLRTKQCR